MSESALDSSALPHSWEAQSQTDRQAAFGSVDARCGLQVECRTNDARPSNGSLFETRTHSRKIPSPCPGWKRTVDVLGAAALLALLAPGMLAVAALIKCVSRGPVMYRQRRFGLGGHPFKVWKFRTVEVSHEGGRHRSHVEELMASNRRLEKRDDQLAIIRGGKLLRQFGIDELPQLFNVLRGEMSLVGPRPDVLPSHSYAPLHRRRFDVLPGITGLWQVKGKNTTTFRRMMQLDLAYVRRRSLPLDLVILCLTIPAVFGD